MNLQDFLAFDVETANPERSSICQIGYVVVKELKVVEEVCYLIQPPGNEYSAINSNLHGLSALDTKDEPFLPEIWKLIEKDFKAYILVAHNASFDLNALVSSLAYYNIPNPNLDCLCTMRMTGLGLKSLCESLEINLEKHHDALADAKACAESLIDLMNGKEPNHNLIHPEESKNPFIPPGYEKIQGDVLKPNLEVEDKDNPFYAKKVVFTGVLNSISRKDAAVILKNKGADIDTTVTKRTRYVIAGAGAGPSKLKKIDQLKQAGSDIEIITENQFLKMIEN